ncbi:hypothetical protein AGIG_G19074 [Arapaima gigas]
MQCGRFLDLLQSPVCCFCQFWDSEATLIFFISSSATLLSLSPSDPIMPQDLPRSCYHCIKSGCSYGGEVGGWWGH